MDATTRFVIRIIMRLEACLEIKIPPQIEYHLSLSPSLSLPPLLFPRLKSPYPQTKTQVQGGALESHQQFLLLSITCDTSNSTPPKNNRIWRGGASIVHLFFLSFLRRSRINIPASAGVGVM